MGQATTQPFSFDFSDYANSFNVSSNTTIGPTSSTVQSNAFPLTTVVPTTHQSMQPPNTGLPDWSGDFDPFQLILAMSSRMPTIEQHSTVDETSPMSAQAVTDASGMLGAGKGKGKYVKVTWWRPHGQTAIAPGALAIKYPSLKLTCRFEEDDVESTPR